jgi:hypothetical protein
VAWAIWLLVPVLVTVVAALVVWWRGRPSPTPTPTQAIREHQRYLDALAEPPRERDRRR